MTCPRSQRKSVEELSPPMSQSSTVPHNLFCCHNLHSLRTSFPAITYLHYPMVGKCTDCLELPSTVSSAFVAVILFSQKTLFPSGLKNPEPL